MAAPQLLDACEEIIDAGRGVLACHCPYCQGYLEVMPVAGQLDIGYLRNHRFDVVLSLPVAGLEVELAREGAAMKLGLPTHAWEFAEQAVVPLR